LYNSGSLEDQQPGLRDPIGENNRQYFHGDCRQEEIEWIAEN